MKNTWADEYYRSLLTAKEQHAYDTIVRNWEEYNGNLSLHACGIQKDQISEIIVAAIKDHPELFWVNYYRYQYILSPYSVQLRMNFFFNTEEIRYFKGEVRTWKNRIGRQVPSNFTEKEKIWLLYDYLSRQVTYGKQESGYSQTIIGPISRHNHVSVCEGIAKSFKVLCDEAHIGCIVVFGQAGDDTGKQEPHAWNIVSCEGTYRHIDVTGALETSHYFGKAQKKNFLHKDTEMTKYSWERRLTPRCV